MQIEELSHVEVHILKTRHPKKRRELDQQGIHKGLESFNYNGLSHSELAHQNPPLNMARWHQPHLYRHDQILNNLSINSLIRQSAEMPELKLPLESLCAQRQYESLGSQASNTAKFVSARE